MGVENLVCTCDVASKTSRGFELRSVVHAHLLRDSSIHLQSVQLSGFDLLPTILSQPLCGRMLQSNHSGYFRKEDYQNTV